MTNLGKTFRPEPLTPSEAQRLLDAITGSGPIVTRNRALLSTLWRSGLRVSELLALKPADVDLVAGTVRVLRGKKGSYRVAVIDHRAIEHLRSWLVVRERLKVNGRHKLFCSVGSGPHRSPGRPMNPSYVRRLLPQLGAKAGIDKRVHCHGLRHSFAAELLDRNVPIQVISAALGHRSISTTDLYLKRISPQDMIAALRASGMTIA